MEHKDMFRLFYTALQILTPANTFEDVYAALIYSARVNGYGEYEDAITEAFHKNNVLNDEYTRYELESTVIAPDCGRMTFSADDADTVCVVVIYDALYGDLLMSTWPDVNGIVNLCLPDGRYYVMVYLTDLATGNTDAYVYTANGWEDPETSSGKVIRISNGRIKELAGLD